MKYRNTLNAERLSPNAQSKTLNLEQRKANTVFKFFSCCLVFVMCTANALALSDKDKILLLKNFPFLSMLEEPLKKLDHTQYDIITIVREHDAVAATKDCRSVSCFSKLQFTKGEIGVMGRVLQKLVERERTIGKLVNTLKTDGLYPLFKNEADTVYVRKVWEIEARGIAYILNTYIGAQKPLYPKIDSISVDTADAGFHEKLAERVKDLLQSKSLVFYSIPMMLALEALKLNERDEAARYEPLTAEENAAAYRSVKKLRWNKYPYSAILVPGLGPEQPDVKLDPNGAKRCDSAAIRYREGKAPFIVVSGGHVHPYKTPWCEAVEMKKYMVEKLQIPASAIIIEPHARHTTTNLRNTNRLIYLFKIPAGKPVLIVTDAAQNNYINGNMKEKVVKELGYVPFSSIKKLSATETEYLPSDNSMQANSLDPLDP